MTGDRDVIVECTRKATVERYCRTEVNGIFVKRNRDGGEGGIYGGKMEKEIWNETGSLSICSFAAKFRKIKRLSRE